MLATLPSICVCPRILSRGDMRVVAWVAMSESEIQQLWDDNRIEAGHSSAERGMATAGLSTRALHDRTSYERGVPH